MFLLRWLILALLILPWIPGSSLSSYQWAERIDLYQYKDSNVQQPIIITDKAGLTLTLEPEMCPGQEYWCSCSLTVTYQGAKIKEIKNTGWFMALSRYECAPVTYWILEEYTGGAHCCLNWYVFCRAGSGKPVKFLGVIPLEHGLPPNGELVSCLDGKIWLRSFDWRFAYFHTSFAQSFPFLRHQVITPEGITLHNEEFRQEYLDQVSDLNRQIKEELSRRRVKPQSIISGDGVPGDLTDDLAVLLVERTVNYLVAREAKKAWESLEADVKKYYRSLQGLNFLKTEINRVMESSPY